MATYLSNELGGSAGQTAVPVGYKPRATAYAARFKRMRATITLNAQATTDTVVLGYLPAGSVFAYGVLTASATLGTSTVAVGVAGATGKYRAAATFTAADTPTMFGTAATVAATDAGSAADEQVFMTIATAALPASGTLVVDLYYSAPN